MINNKNFSGDTIVEVMIAIVVLGAALGGAFAISNKSQLTTQANHERYQAQVLANGQAELLRTSYANHLKTGGKRATYLYTADGCLNTAGAWQAYSPSCENVLNLYKISLKRLTAAEAGKVPGVTDITFRIEVVWDSLTSITGQDRVELLYGI